MIRKLIHYPVFLARPSVEATQHDLSVAEDLLDTLRAHKETCVGMAANMIGVRKRIIAFLDESGLVPTYTVMLNPVIVEKSGAYETTEGCLSLLNGPRPCTRYEKIKVRYQTTDMVERTRTYSGWTAQIVQHEVDHCEGILI